MSRFLKGKLYIECRGDCERLLCRCAEHNISLWNIERTSDLNMRFCCTPESFYALHRICRQGMCRLHILKKSGTPFALKRMFARPVLLAGLALCLLCLWGMGRYVWNIEIESNGDINKHNVMMLLNEAGLRPGIPIRNVRAQTIRNAVIMNTDEISHMTINVSGTTAKVKIYEKTDSKASYSTEPCDIVSGLTGIITDIRIKHGTSMVRKWQSIYKGDLIASGEMIDQNGQIHYVKADAEIDVRTLHTRKCVLPKELFEYIPTQNTKKRSYLIVGDRCVKLYLIESIGYKWYYKSTERKTLSLKEGFPLPVTLVTETYTQCDRQEHTPQEPDLRQLLQERMTAAFVLSRPDAAIINSEFNLLSSSDAYEGIMRFECSESTGIEIAR